MSADSWAVCPRCHEAAQATQADALKQAHEAYGHVPVDEFDVLRARAAIPLDVNELTTFREDHEFYGVRDGIIVAVYRGECDRCGLTVSFRHEEPFWTPTEATS